MLRAAARALGAFCDPQLPLWGRADLVRSRLVDQLSRRWQRHMSRIVGVLRGGGCGVVGLWGYMGLRVSKGFGLGRSWKVKEAKGR